MAEELTDHKPYTRRKHDWDTWFNGKTWLLRQGEDFTAKIVSFNRMCRTKAKEMGFKVELVNAFLPVNADGSLNLDPQAPRTHPSEGNGCWTITIRRVGRLNRA